MERKIGRTVVDKINASEWWHVPPQDPDAYRKRGKFLASTYSQAEFYGRPFDIPERVLIKNPVYGFSETEILKQLFPAEYRDMALPEDAATNSWYKRRISLDAKMFKEAKSLGYDAIVLFSPTGRKHLKANRKPPSIELNLLYA